MRTEIITAPTGEIANVESVKISQRISGSAEDEFIATLISVARKYCEKKLRRTLLTTELKGYFSQFSEMRYLPKAPIQSVESVSYYNSSGDLTVLDESFYVVNPGEYGGIRLAPSQSWPDIYAIEEAIVVEYTAGYADESGSPVVSGSGVPPEIVHAIKMHVGHLYSNRESMSLDDLKPVGMAYESLLVDYWVPEL